MAGPAKPPWLPSPSMVGSGLKLSRLTEVMEFTVLIRLTASAPPARDARAA